jgi:hypothetical protein
MSSSWPPNADEIRKYRLELLLRCLQDPTYAAITYGRCKDDPIYFLEMFGWVEDRQTAGDAANAVPIVLYPQQKEFIIYFVDILWKAVRDETFAYNELIEKARKTAGTWTVLLIFLWFWCFHNASFLVLSKKEDDVDREGDLDTPFEKMRFFLRKVPAFLLPEGFDITKKLWSKTMLIKSPRGGQISGDSSSSSATRQKRALACLYDEFAFAENDKAIWAAGSGTVKVRVAVSTPNGTNNYYYRLRWGKDGEKVHVTSFTWWRHPVFGKDLRTLASGKYTSPWYESICAANSLQTIARDYDLNYADSLGAKIFHPYSGQHVDDKLAPHKESKLVRIWDPGLTFAVVWAEIDRYERLLFYRELIMKNAVLDHVAEAVLEITAQMVDGAKLKVEDIGDPANVYRRGSITEDTEYSILQRRYGIYVRTHSISSVGPQKRTTQSIAYLLDKMGTFSKEAQTPLLVVNPVECPVLHEAFMGAYTWELDQQGNIREGHPAQVHPYEDVADCARYLALHAQGGLQSTGSRPNLHVVKKQGSWTSPGRHTQKSQEGWSNIGA